MGASEFVPIYHKFPNLQNYCLLTKLLLYCLVLLECRQKQQNRAESRQRLDDLRGIDENKGWEGKGGFRVKLVKMVEMAGKWGQQKRVGSIFQAWSWPHLA